MKRRPDGRWQKRITLPNGKSKLIYSTAATERLANKEFNDYLLNFEEEEKNSDLFEIVAEEWKEKHFPKMQNNTLKQYRPCYNAAVKYFKGTTIGSIKPYHIQEYIDSLIKKEYAQKTIKNRVLLVRLILGYGVLYNKIEHNPCSEIKVKTTQIKNKRQKASDEDEQIIRNNTEGLMGVLAYLFLVTGCRRGEAAALTPQDVDIKNGCINIDKTIEWDKGRPQVKPFPKTEAGFRSIPIPPKLIKLLIPLMNNKYLFPNAKGSLFTDSNLTDTWNRYKNKVGIKCTPHQLRHSYATILFDAGIDIKTAQRWLGHKDINTTLAIYTHLSETALQKNTQKITDYFVANF